MKAKFAIASLALLFATSCMARPHDYQRGELLQMDSTSCGMQEKDGKTIAGEILGTEGQHKKSVEVLCQEYTLQSDHVLYRIRATDDKHPALLPIGETAEFRIHKDKLILRVPEGDNKEHSYYVISMTPRTKTLASAEEGN